MAKKRRDINLSPAQMVQPGVEKAAAVGVGEAASASGESDLAEEYRYVIADLKRIGVIAVVMLAILIALMLLLA